MKAVLPLIIFLLLFINSFSQANQKAIPVINNPAKVAEILFSNVKTNLTPRDKTFFAKDIVYLVFDDDQDGKKDTILTYIEDDKDRYKKFTEDDIQRSSQVDIFPADLNNDAIEEIFLRKSGCYIGCHCTQPLQLYIKDKSGNYKLQDVMSEETRLSARTTSNLNYPDLIGSAPECGGINNIIPTKFNVYRWNGNAYQVYQKQRPPLKTDKSIEEVISPAYQKNPVKTSTATSYDDTDSKSVGTGSPKKQSGQQTSSGSNKEPSMDTPEQLTPLASYLFSNTKTKLTIAEKNALVKISELTASDTIAKNKKGEPKIQYKVLPVDFNNDGIEEIFIRVKTTALILPVFKYAFYAKDVSGKYRLAPGRIGQNTRAILNGKSGFPDLLVIGDNGYNEIWSWNNLTYVRRQVLQQNTPINFRTINVEKVSSAYTDH